MNADNIFCQAAPYARPAAGFDKAKPATCLCWKNLKNELHGWWMVWIDLGVGLGGRLHARGVDGISELFGWLKEGNSFRWYIDLLPSFGVTACACVPLSRSKAAESANLNFVTGFKCADNGFKEGIDDHFAIATSEVAEGGYFVDKISFGHERGPFNQGGPSGLSPKCRLTDLIINGMQLQPERKPGKGSREGIF
jgi:hypothetical protein